jgi:DNA-binding transcriptional LysR family regulator
VREGGGEKRFTPPATHQLSDGESMVNAAVGGLVLCQVLISMVRDRLETGTLVAVLSDYSTVPVDVHMIWPRRAHLSPRARYVVDQLVSYADGGQLN